MYNKKSIFVEDQSILLFSKIVSTFAEHNSIQVYFFALFYFICSI